MLGHGSPQKSQTTGRHQAPFDCRDQAVIQRGCAEGKGEIAGQAEATELRAAAHHFHHVDVRPCGVGGDHRGVAEGVAAPGLLGHGGGEIRFDRLDRLQQPFGIEVWGVQRRHIDARNLRQVPQTFGPWCVSYRLQGIDEGWKKVLPIPQQDHIEKRCQRFGVRGQHRATSEHDRVSVRSLFAPDRDALAFEQIQQHRAIQFPAQGQTEQIAAAVLGISLIGEQPAHIQIGSRGQRGPNDLVTKAGDSHRVRAGERQDRAQGTGFRNGRIEQQRFLIQGS